MFSIGNDVGIVPYGLRICRIQTKTASLRTRFQTVDKAPDRKIKIKVKIKIVGQAALLLPTEAQLRQNKRLIGEVWQNFSDFSYCVTAVLPYPHTPTDGGSLSLRLSQQSLCLPKRFFDKQKRQFSAVFLFDFFGLLL